MAGQQTGYCGLVGTGKDDLRQKSKGEECGGGEGIGRARQKGGMGKRGGDITKRKTLFERYSET